VLRQKLMENMAKSWYALRSKPNKEEFLACQLESRGVDYYYPCIQARPINPRARKYKPYFPGYLFIRTDLVQESTQAYERVPGAANLVSFGGEVPAVPDAILQAIRRMVDEVNASGGEMPPTVSPGTTVNIEAGPFAGYQAIFDSNLPGRERVRVLLKMLQQRQIPVELPAEYVKPARQKRTSK